MDFTDTETLYKAMLTRDKRFDGRFYIGVRTTGIYCRPICPARPKKENVTFYRSHAEAENAGYRPCLRCRPDISPGSQMWEGTAALVGRALKMISSGEADSISLTRFATKLGVTDRHLRRLFEEHLGAAPIDVAISKRLHLARLLLSQTSLSVTEIVFASGFNSIRRFNEAFRRKYKRTPREFRKEHKENAISSEGIRLLLPILEPYDWEYIHRFLSTHRTSGVEHIEEGKYQRLLWLDQRPVRVSVERDPQKPHLVVDVEGANVTSLRPILSNVRNLFDIDHNPFHPVGSGNAKNPKGIRIPGAFDPFETAVCIILGQLVSVEQASVKIRKLVNSHGKQVKSSFQNLTHLFPSPDILAQADLSTLGITKVRSEAIRELARRVTSGNISLGRASPLQETREKLSLIKGIGPWTVEMIAMRCLGDTNAFPKNDLIIQRALEKLNINVESWNPWKAYLTLWIWRDYAEKLSRKGKKK